jgi:hypothetical protein
MTDFPIIRNRDELVKNYESNTFDAIADLQIDTSVTDAEIRKLTGYMAEDLITMRGDLATAFECIKRLCLRGDTSMFFNKECFNKLVKAVEDKNPVSVLVTDDAGNQIGLLQADDLVF